MADNTIINLGAGGDTISTDDIAGVKVQRVKVMLGADGVNGGDVSSANPLPISDAGGAITVDATNLDTRDLTFASDKVDASGSTLGANSGVDIGDTTINNAAGAAAVNIQDGGNSITVDATSLPLPTGAATEATLGDIKTSVQLLDNIVYADGDARGTASGMLVMGDDGTLIQAIKAVPLSTQVLGADMGLVTHSVIHGQTTAGGGTYVDVKVNPSGSLQMALGDISGIDGQAAMAASIPVVIASDQSTVNVAVASALPEGNNNIGTVNLGGPGTIDSFGHVITGTINNQIDVQFYRNTPQNLTTVTVANGGAASATNGMATFSTTAAANSSSKGVSLTDTLYTAGAEIYALFTAGWTGTGSGTSYQRIGLYDANNGFFIGKEGNTFGVTVRKTGGDVTVAKAAFSEDTLVGGANSKFTRAGVPEAIDLTQLNVWRIRFGWVGSAPINYEVLAPDGNWVTFHKILQPNNSALPSINEADLPVTCDINNGNSGAALTIITNCWAAGTTQALLKLNATLADTNYAALTRSVITGITTGGGGGYVNVKVNPSGAIVADVSSTNLDIRDLAFATDKVDASGTVLGAGTNNIGDVDVLSIAAGTNYVGKVRLTDGTTDAEVIALAGSNAQAVAIVDGAGAQITSFGGGTQYTEDVASAADPVGNMMIARRRDSPVTEADTDGDNVALNATSSGHLLVSVSGGTINIIGTDTDASSNNLTGVMVMAKDRTGALDYFLEVKDLTNSNPLLTAIVDGNGDQITTFGGGTQYTEADTDASITGTAMMMEGAGDELVPAQGTVADGLLVNLGSNNDVTVTNPTATNLKAEIVGTGTLAVQESGAALTALQLIDDTVYTDGAGTVTKGIAILGQDGTNPQAIKTDASGELQVDVLTMPTVTVSATNLDVRDLLFASDKVDASGTVLGAGTNNIGDVDVLSLPALPTGTNNIGDVDVLTIAAGDNNIGNVDIVTLPALVAGTAYIGKVRLTDGTLDATLVDETGASAVDVIGIGGGTPHDSVDSGNPVKIGGVAVSGSASPTSVASGDRTRFIANQHGIQYSIGGHPNLITREYDFGTAAQTDVNLAAAVVAADERIYVTRLEVLCDNANTVAVSARVGFGTANVPAASATGVSGMIASHPGIAAGSGIICGNGSGVIAVGAAGEEPRITTSAATTGNTHVIISYFLIDETP